MQNGKMDVVNNKKKKRKNLSKTTQHFMYKSLTISYIKI